MVLGLPKPPKVSLHKPYYKYPTKFRFPHIPFKIQQNLFLLEMGCHDQDLSFDTHIAMVLVKWVSPTYTPKYPKLPFGHVG